jgi:predicted ATPase
MKFFREKTKQFQYIVAERIGPRDIYEASNVTVVDKKQLGLSGEYAAYYINMFGFENIVSEALRHPQAISNKLIAQVNAWMQEISPGVSLNTKYVPEVNKVILDFQYELTTQKTNHFRPKNVGFGISYVLPVVLALLTAEEGKIIVIENPESHIHPRGQAELGKLIALAASVGAQLFIETHSDHILNGIRVAVKEGNIDKSKVNVMYFEKITTDTEQYTKINQIKIDKNGTLSDYPKDFLDEWSNQLFKLM